MVDSEESGVLDSSWFSFHGEFSAKTGEMTPLNLSQHQGIYVISQRVGRTVAWSLCSRLLVRPCDCCI